MPAWEVKLYIKLFFSKGDLDERSDDWKRNYWRWILQNVYFKF